MDGPSPVSALSSVWVISGIVSKVVVPVGVAVVSAVMGMLVILSVLSVSEVLGSALSGENVLSLT